MVSKLTSLYLTAPIVRKYSCRKIKVSVNLKWCKMILIRIYLRLTVRIIVNLKVKLKFKMEVMSLSGHVHRRLIVQKWTDLKLKYLKIMISSIHCKLMTRNSKCEFRFKFRIKKRIHLKCNNHSAHKGPIWHKIPVWLKKLK
jgi:hypothetical protein